MGTDGCRPTDEFCRITVVLPSAGRCAIVLPTNPSPTSATNFILQLSHDEDRGVLPFGIYTATPVFGQTLTYHYDGTAGDTINVSGATVLDPGGVALTPMHSTLYFDHVTLPVTGTYTVLAFSSAILSRDLVGGSIGLGNTVTPSLYNNIISYTYAGTAGEALGIGTFGPRVVVLDPGGTPLPDGLVEPIRRVTLPVDGIYTLIVRASEFGMRVVSLWLTHDLDGGTITAGFTSTPNLPPGQSFSYEYLGTAGEVLRVRTSWNWYGPPPVPRMFTADGTEISRFSYNDGTNDWDGFTLSTTGSYRILVSPDHPATVGMTLRSIL